MLKHFGVFSCLLVVSSVLSGPEASAAVQKTSVICGQTITESITVANDLIGCTGHGLVIGAPDVEINMDGHTFTGDDGSADNGIDNSAGHQRLVVYRGKVEHFGSGVFVKGASDTFNHIHDMEFRTNAKGVVLSSANRNEVEFSSFIGNTIAGIALDTNSAFNDLLVNGFADNATGIDIDGSNNFLVTNDFSGGTLGIRISGGNFNKLSRNDLFAPGGNIELVNADSNRLERNKLLGVSGSGIRISSGSDSNQLYKNQVRSSTANGIEVGSGCNMNLIHNNKLRSNAEDGILDEGTATDIRNNAAMGNGFSSKEDLGDGVGLGIDASADLTATSEDNKAKKNDNAAECSSNIDCN